MNALLKQNKLVKLKLYILNNHIEKKEFWLNLVDLQIGDTCKAVIYFTEHLPEKKSNLCLGGGYATSFKDSSSIN